MTELNDALIEELKNHEEHNTCGIGIRDAEYLSLIVEKATAVESLLSFRKVQARSETIIALQERIDSAALTSDSAQKHLDELRAKLANVPPLEYKVPCNGLG